MIDRDALTLELNDLLQPQQFQDYCPNGLQVAGSPKIKRLITGVTACLALIDAAIQANADAILVHHGYFWKNEDPNIVGIKHQRISKLIQADLNLYAYHLPLDAHPKYGNNVQLAQKLGIDLDKPLSTEPLVWTGSLSEPLSGQVLANYLLQVLAHEPIHIEGHKRLIRKVAWCSGGAQNYITAAANAGADAYISGEISESTTHIARELGIDYFAAGHHATERFGVQAIGEHLAKHFGLEHQFINIPNPA